MFNKVLRYYFNAYVYAKDVSHKSKIKWVLVGSIGKVFDG